MNQVLLKGEGGGAYESSYGEGGGGDKTQKWERKGVKKNEVFR